LGTTRLLHHRVQNNKDVLRALESFGNSLKFQKNEKLFSQDAPAKDLVFIESGRVRLSVISRRGKEVVVGILGAGDFLGESIVTGHPLRATSAIAISDCAVRRISKRRLLVSLRANPRLADIFMKFLVQRNFRIEADLIDQLFNSIEKRLARTLLLLAHFGKTKSTGEVIPRISQEVLAKMVGTTRTRVNLFMNRFKKLGFIHYNGGLRVADSLVRILLRD
jgi:CRP/FNR family transcriptional regulator, cyclic AMP receptor protein